MGSKKNWSKKRKQLFSMILAGAVAFQSGSFVSIDTYAAELDPSQQNVEEENEVEEAKTEESTESEDTKESVEEVSEEENVQTEESSGKNTTEENEESTAGESDKKTTEETVDETTEEATEETTEEVMTEETLKLNTLAMARESSGQEEITVSISDLEKTASWNIEITDREDGAADFLFTKQYGAISYRIPDSVDATRIDQIICNTTDASSMSLKFLKEETMQETELAVCYGSNTLSTSKITDGTPVCIAIMGLEEGYETTIESVTFVMKKEAEEVDTSYGDLTKDCYKDSNNNNPLITQKYGADPGVMVYNDTVYIYMTNDAYEYDAQGNIGENTYSKIQTLNCISSTDLVNWTDHGAIEAAGKHGAATWANNSWAPCATYKNIDGEDKFFLYFADNGGGIGVLTADSPTGPWTDPLGHGFITRSTPNCATVEWLFDPAVFVDDDGTGYLYFGGGVPSGKAADPGTARVVQLGDDMISIVGEPKQINPPYLFEDSGINKIGDKYYYSYCSNFSTGGSSFKSGTIQYMVSDDPMGPFEYVDELFLNPSTFFNDNNGNNHHCMFEFKGDLYLAYHARALEKAVLGKGLGYRSTQIDKVTMSGENLDEVTGTMAGVSQTENVNPFKEVSATMMARQKGIEVNGSDDPALSVTEDDWTCIKGVDFKTGLESISINIKAAEDMEVEVRTGSEDGSKLGTIEVEATDSFEDFSASMRNIAGVKDVYFVFKGEAEVRSWVATSAEGGLDIDIETEVPDLKDAMTDQLGDDFKVGTAIMLSEITDDNLMALVTKHFNAVTFGNELKPDAIFDYNNNSCPGTETVELNGEDIVVPVTNFDRAEKMLDKIYDWNEQHPDEIIKIRGHVLTWHSQTPEWFFHEDYDASKPYVDTDTMNKRHEWYIKTVLQHFTGEDSKYKDMFYGWDVVNEAVSDGTGTYRSDSENSSWWAVYHSNEFIINAFRFANKYAPSDLELYYNDYNEYVDSKVKGISQLLKDVKEADGTRIDGMGMQGHYATVGSPSMTDFKNAARTYNDIVGQVQITELDFKASSSYDGTSATYDEENTRLGYRYKELYDAIQELRAEDVNITNMTVWGVVDKNSWLQTSSSVGGGANGRQKQMPLLFDDNYKVKPAYWAFVDTNKLEPEIQSFDILQCSNIADEEKCFANGNTLSFGNGITEATAVPVWSTEGLKVKVTVADATNEDTDAVTVYIAKNKKVQKVTVARSEGTETSDGYEVIVTVPCDAAMLAVSNEVQMDFVVTDGEQKIAFNDRTLSQDSKVDYYAKAILKPFIVIPKGTVTVDGEMEDAWNNAASMPLTINLGTNVSANAKLLWDNDYLYVYADVVDPVLNADSTAVHEKDSMEIFIDENNHKSPKYEEDDKQYRINYLDEHSFNGTKCLEENLKTSVAVNDHGYTMELAIAWTDITPVIGEMIGLELQVNDADASGKRIGTLSWYDKSGSGWENPSVFGTAVLGDGDGTGNTPGQGGETKPGENPGQGGETNPGENPGQGGENNPGEQPGQEDKPAQDVTPSIGNDNNTTQSASNSSSKKSSSKKNNSSATKVTTGITVETTIQDAQTPLAPTVNEAGFSFVNVTLDKDFKLKSDLFLQYRGLNTFLMTYLSNGIGYTIDANQEISQDLNLETTRTELPGFADGFKAIQIAPTTKAVLNYSIGMHVNLGADNQGKAAYIFKKNMTTNAYEIFEIVTIDQIGNVAIQTNELTDVMILMMN